MSLALEFSTNVTELAKPDSQVHKPGDLVLLDRTITHQECAATIPTETTTTFIGRITMTPELADELNQLRALPPTEKPLAEVFHLSGVRLLGETRVCADRIINRASDEPHADIIFYPGQANYTISPVPPATGL